MAFAEGVATRDKGNGLLHRHPHAREGIPHFWTRGHRIRVAVGTLRVDINQPHLNRRQGLIKRILTAVALISEPLGFLAPEHILFGLPDVGAAAGKSEGAKPHGFQRHIAAEDDQVSPRNGIAILLLQWPEQAPCLVEVGVVWPAVERRKALIAMTGATTTVGAAIGASAMPGQTNEQTAVVTPVRWPPVLGVGHQCRQIRLQGIQVHPSKGSGVIEGIPQGIGGRVVLVQEAKVNLIGPPLAVSRMGRWGDGSGMTTKRTFQIRHETSTPMEGM